MRARFSIGWFTPQMARRKARGRSFVLISHVDAEVQVRRPSLATYFRHKCNCLRQVTGSICFNTLIYKSGTMIIFLG